MGNPPGEEAPRGAPAGATRTAADDGENHGRRSRNVERQHSRATLIPSYVRELQHKVRQLEQDNAQLRRKVERLEHTTAEMTAPTWADIGRVQKVLSHLQSAPQQMPPNGGHVAALLQALLATG